MWDGKTPDGKRTGGQMYKCTKCGEKGYSKEDILKKGGVMEEGFNVYGKPLPNPSSSS